MKLAVPERISWAVDKLDIAGAETILEIGCGGGKAAALTCDRLSTGRLVAIDRSATAATATLERPQNRAHVDAGRLEVLATPLADLKGFGAAFDLVFAVNVNVFWIDPRREMPVVRRVLKPRGDLALFYEPPTVERGREIVRLVAEKLAAHGFDTSPAEFHEGAKLFHMRARLGN